MIPEYENLLFHSSTLLTLKIRVTNWRLEANGIAHLLQKPMP